LSRRRLELWDVPEHQIKELEETGQIMKTLHIHSPSGGIVTEKPVVEGMFVKPGTTLYTIADISTVWVYADVYEYELPWVMVGQEAEMTLASYPGRVFKGKVSFVYPFMEPRTRTNKVRLEFKNPAFELKPDMYANVALKTRIKGEFLTRVMRS
jgi:multidrug efflux pump subunit AcrA (membrane-fusion protein)